MLFLLDNDGRQTSYGFIIWQYLEINSDYLLTPRIPRVFPL